MLIKSKCVSLKSVSKFIMYIFFFVNIVTDGEKVACVDNFTYLGINLSYSDTMSKAIKQLSDQTRRTYYNLFSLFDKVKLDIRTKLSLFHSLFPKTH